MPATRRDILSLLGTASLTGLAGCSDLLGSGQTSEHDTGLDENTATALDGTPVYLAGDVANLPTPPTTTDSLDEARVAIATPTADSDSLADALRNGTTVAFAGENAPNALQTVLGAVSDEYRYGTETVKGRPVGTAVAVPRSDTIDTLHFVDEGGWDDPVLDPIGWTFSGRIPDCETVVAGDPTESKFDLAGTATLVGRLESGETYLSRTMARVRPDGNDGRLVRFDTTMHAAATGGYNVAEARRVADVANDETVRALFPNSHEKSGVEVSNNSDPIENRLDASFAPTTDETRTDFAGCCGFTADAAVGYDHRTTWSWKKNSLIGSNDRSGGGSGRGEWHVGTG